jgi:hypothetical protein
MKPIEVRDKTHIKQLLYAEHVFGVKGDQFRGFGGFQLWWYDRHRGLCDCCESHWFDPRKRVTHYSLERAARILWHHRKDLYMRIKHVDEDRGIQALEHLEDARH